MRQPAQHLVAAILKDDRLGHHRAKPRHPIAQPFGHVPAMEWKVGAARSPSHQRTPVAATREAAWRAVAGLRRCFVKQPGDDSGEGTGVVMSFVRS
jgi:hypothetical protein